MPRLLCKTYAFDLELLTVASHLGYHKILEAPISKAAAKRLGIFGSTAVEPIEAIKIVINQQIEEEKHLQQEAVKIQARLIYLANRREKLKNGLAKLLEQL